MAFSDLALFFVGELIHGVSLAAACGMGVNRLGPQTMENNRHGSSPSEFGGSDGQDIVVRCDTVASFRWHRVPSDPPCIPQQHVVAGDREEIQPIV